MPGRGGNDAVGKIGNIRPGNVTHSHNDAAIDGISARRRPIIPIADRRRDTKAPYACRLWQRSSEIRVRKIRKHLSSIPIDLFCRWRWSVLRQKASRGKSRLFLGARVRSASDDFIDGLADQRLRGQALCPSRRGKLGFFLRLKRQRDSDGLAPILYYA